MVSKSILIVFKSAQMRNAFIYPIILKTEKSYVLIGRGLLACWSPLNEINLFY